MGAAPPWAARRALSSTLPKFKTREQNKFLLGFKPRHGGGFLHNR